MPAPVPVVNEYEGVQSDVEKIARQLHAQHQDEPVWDKLHSNRQDDYYLSASRVLALPAVAAAFEAQAKLEAADGLVRWMRENPTGLVEVVPIYTDDDRLIEKIAEVADPDDEQVWQATLATEAGTVKAFGRWIDGRDDAVARVLAAWPVRVEEQGEEG